MSGQDFYMFKNIITQSEKSAILNYMLPYQITEGNSIVTSYDQLTNQVTAVSSSFNLPISQITIADIGNKLEYFKLPMALSGSKDFSSSCPYYKTDQYKCVPFHRLKDLSGNEVIKDANTMADLLKAQDEQNNQGMSVSVKWAFAYIGIVIGVAIIIIFMGWLVRLLTSSTPPGGGGAAAAAAVGTAAAVATATATPAPAAAAPAPAPAPVAAAP